MTRAEYIARNIPKVPLPIVYRMMNNQVDQGNKMSVDVFIKNIIANRKEGGFDWTSTAEGLWFWNQVLLSKKYDMYFERYPKEKSICVDDFILNNGYINEFPICIIEKMLSYQVEQGNEKDVFVFQCNPYSDNEQGGFDWGKTCDGYEFWDSIITYKNYDVFFDAYSTEIKYGESGDLMMSNPCCEMPVGGVFNPNESPNWEIESKDDFVTYNICEFNFKDIE